MATTYYAWSPILYGVEVDQKTGVRNPRKDRVAKLGSEVSAESLGIEQEEFDELVASGAVRALEFPKDMPEGYQGSPVDWLRLKAAEAANDVENGVAALMTNINEPTITSKEKEKQADVGTNAPPPTPPPVSNT